MRILVIGSGAREHALLGRCGATPVSATCTSPRATRAPASLATSHPVDVSRPGRHRRARRASICARSGRDRTRGAAGQRRCRRAAVARVRGLRAERRCRPDRGFEGVRQGRDGRGRRADRRRRSASPPRRRSTTPSTRCGSPYVVKDDGLAAGKGVVVTDDRAAAHAHAVAVLASGHPVLVEEYLAGPEVSLFAVCDGVDRGPAAAGAGLQTGRRRRHRSEHRAAWGPTRRCRGLRPDLVDLVQRTVLDPVLAEMARRGTPFSGLLYAGLVLTAAGPKVIEFNCRFGDPETQVVLELLRHPARCAAGRRRGRRAGRGRPAGLARRGGRHRGHRRGELPGHARSPVTSITGPDADGILHAGTAVGRRRVGGVRRRPGAVRRRDRRPTWPRARAAAYAAGGAGRPARIAPPHRHRRRPLRRAGCSVPGHRPDPAVRRPPSVRHGGRRWRRST